MARRKKRKKGAITEDGIKIISQNRKARYDYHTLDTWEAGIALKGTEVKSLRDGKANLLDSYARIDGNEVFLHNVHIGEYDAGNQFNHEPMRTRKLLLHRQEINRMRGRVEEKGLTLIPLKMYFKKSRAKVEIALAKGKRDYDRRQDIAKRDARRDMEQALKERTQQKD